MNDPDTLLDWQDGQLRSLRYGDVYFSRDSGIDETRYVFLAQNRLAERFGALRPGDRFVIGETGFGTGLNFLCTWKLWAQCAPRGARLHFASIEKHPLTREDMARALSLWPELAPQREALLRRYRQLPPGWHRFHFDPGVVLTVAVSDVAEALPQLELQADAWYLDGFAPARNPEMWSFEVLRHIGARTKPGGTFATYTAAGAVRRGLEAAGFAVERVKGHGAKREMLRGVLREASQQPDAAPWFRRPERAWTERRAIVIGGGLAGTSAAASLARRGWSVVLIERHERLAAEASGNPQGILYTRLAAQATPLRELVIGGYGHTLRLLATAALAETERSHCGLLQLAFDTEEAARQQKLLAQDFPSDFLRGVNREEASDIAGVELPFGGLYFPESGWTDPAALCRMLAAHDHIDVRLHTEALALRREGEQWAVHGPRGCIEKAPVLLLATARDTLAFESARHLPLKTIRGQISLIPETPASSRLHTVLCGEGYIAPARTGWHTLGATHKFEDVGTDVRADEHRENLAMLQTLAPPLHAALGGSALDCDTLPGWAAVRVSTPDYLPLIGPLADAQAFAGAYAALRHDARQRPDTPCPWLPGLYVSTAHGSRGLITAPLAGEMLAAYLEDEPAPVSSRVMAAVHPNRFLVRALIRRER